MCDTCTDPQLCRDTNICWSIAVRQNATDEMTRIAQENGEYEEIHTTRKARRPKETSGETGKVNRGE